MKLLVTLNCFAFTAAGLVSVTLTWMTLVLGPCASLGVHEIAPLAGLMVIPVGDETKAKVSGFAGRSASVAEALTLNVVSSSMV